MRPQQPYIRPLRIELATRSDIVRFLNAAVRLAKIMGAELEAVFLQDQEMLDAAALPVVQEVCLWTAQEQHTSTTLLSRSMRIQAKQTQTLLAEIAGREAVPCSYVFDQNQLVEPEETLAESCIRWVGGSRLPSRPDTCPVCVIDSGDNAGQACLQQAADLSSRANRPLRVYKLDGSNQSEHQAKIDNLDHCLQQAGNLPCFVLFMPKSTYEIYRSTRMLDLIPFPVLLV